MSKQKHIRDWIEQGFIPTENSQEAYSIANATPSAREWNQTIQQTFLWMGALGMVLSISFFIAFNWNFVGRFTTFASLQVIFLGVLGLYWKQQSTNLRSKVSLTVLSVLVGIMLAFFGQTYQTGADPWQLFAFWALIITPWAFMSRFPPLWSMWTILLNTAVLLNTHLIFYSKPYTVFLLNALIWVGWEYSIQKLQWSRSRWPIWLLSLVSGLAIQLVVIDEIFNNQWNLLALGGYAAWIAIVIYIYQKKISDLFLLTVVALSMSATAITITTKLMPDWDTYAFFIMGVVCIFVTSIASFWLRNVHQNQGTNHE